MRDADMLPALLDEAEANAHSVVPESGDFDDAGAAHDLAIVEIFKTVASIVGLMIVSAALLYGLIWLMQP